MNESILPAYCDSCIIAASAEQHDDKLTIKVDRAAGSFYIVHTMKVVRMPLGVKDAMYGQTKCANCGSSLKRGEVR